MNAGLGRYIVRRLTHAEPNRWTNTKLIRCEAMKICISAQQSSCTFSHCFRRQQWTKRTTTTKKKKTRVNIIGQIYLFDFNWKWIRICLIGEWYLCRGHCRRSTTADAQTTTAGIDSTTRTPQIQIHIRSKNHDQSIRMWLRPIELVANELTN